MTTPIAEDFDHIAKALKKLEEAKAPPPPKTAPEPEQDYDWAYSGSGYVAPDYDPA